MRLLYLHNTPIDSEKANIIQVLYMCDSFSRLGVNVKLAIPESSRPMDREFMCSIVRQKIGRELSFSIITFKKITMLGHLNTLGSYFGARKIINKLKADICFVRAPFFLKLLMDKGIPTIFESHNTLLHNRSVFLHRLWKRRLIQYSKSKKLVKFIAISHALADYWIKNDIDPQKVVSLHDGIDDESFKFVESKEVDRKEIGIKSDEKVVVYAGSLYPDRGIEDILKLAKLFSHVQFIVLGGPSSRKGYFEKESRKNGIGNIQFLGWIPRDKVKKFLFAADVLLMIWTRNVPTINYCSPMKMFEYMAAGRIIVGHGFPTIKEVLTDGVTAYLADPESFQDLQKKMEMALNERYPSAMGLRARELARKEYSWKNRARKILNSLPVNINF